MPNNNKAFSLIELMIVVAIIAVLAAIAIPSYHRYTDKAKFTEIIQAVSPFKLAVESCFHETGKLSECNDIPPFYQTDNNSSSRIKSIIINSTGNQIKIIALSQNIGKENLSYILDSTENTNGQLLWTKNKSSTCIPAGVC